MKKFCFALAIALLAAGAQAQLLDQPDPPQPQDRTLTKAKPVSPLPQALPKLYGESERSNFNDKYFDDYRTDPKFFIGLDFTRNLAVEMGYVTLLSRGFHAVDYGRADERAGALRNRGFSTYLAGKFAVPVGERFEAYAKLGVAYSERAPGSQDKDKDKNIDVGAYANVGAKYKLSDKATLSGEYARYGDTAQKWRSDESNAAGATNANGVSAKLKIGF